MNRLLWGIAFLVLAAAGGWAQSTWRGQAEVWAASAPAEGFVVASNEFPRNTLLSVENYKTKKIIQVRVVASLPVGSSALVLLSPKAAQALDIKVGEAPMVGVKIDPTGADLADNPDPDVNPLAGTPAKAAPAVAVAPVPSPDAVPVPAPVLPLPALTAPAADDLSPARTPLAVADEPDATPVTPGKKVFLTTRDSEPIAVETPVVTEPTVPAKPAAEPAESTGPEPAEPAEPAAPPKVVEVPAPEPAPTAPEPKASPVAETPVVPSTPAVPVVVVAVKPPTGAWVSVPGKVEGPVLGQVSVLSGLEKGRAYIQVGAWANEADLVKALEAVKTYVPLALYQVEGEKNPWRVVAAAPKGQLGLLLMSFKSQGFRTATVVKG